MKGEINVLEIPNRRKPIETKTNEQECILVVSHLPNRDGHILMRINGKSELLHRYVYEKMHGKIHGDAIVRHKCDNPNCVNIDHLELGTHQDNVNDRVERGRSAFGKGNGRSKLTEEDVVYIRTCEGVTVAELSRMFSVDRKAIRSVLQYKTWKHVVVEKNKECNTLA